MSPPVRFEDEADAEYRAAARWYDERRVGLGTSIPTDKAWVKFVAALQNPERRWKDCLVARDLFDRPVRILAAVEEIVPRYPDEAKHELLFRFAAPAIDWLPRQLAVQNHLSTWRGFLQGEKRGLEPIRVDFTEATSDSLCEAAPVGLRRVILTDLNESLTLQGTLEHGELPEEGKNKISIGPNPGVRHRASTLLLGVQAGQRSRSAWRA